MSSKSQHTVSRLEQLADQFASRSYAPYSSRNSACIALLSDGTIVPGVRVENASFPLLISATQNALTTAIAGGRHDFAAFISSRPFTHSERDLLEPYLEGLAVEGNVATSGSPLPPIGNMVDPVHRISYPDDAAGVADAREIAELAWIPESDFPVGCILGSPEGGYVRGVNVEHPDWNLGLCAERNAIGTAVTFGLPEATTMYLTCLKDATGSPCGACRQVLVEHVPDIRLVMDRRPAKAEATTPADLLPHYFAGGSLRGE
jgi:homotetrameric cytidine deaminase